MVLNLHHTELERRKKIKRCYKKRNNLNTITVIKNCNVKELFIVYTTWFPFLNLTCNFFFFYYEWRGPWWDFIDCFLMVFMVDFNFWSCSWISSSSGLIPHVIWFFEWVGGTSPEFELVFNNLRLQILQGRFSILLTTISYVVFVPDECQALQALTIRFWACFSCFCCCHAS